MCCPQRHNEGLGRRVSKRKALVLETEQREKAVGQQHQSQQKLGVWLISTTLVKSEVNQPEIRLPMSITLSVRMTVVRSSCDETHSVA
jgi:hypothetical protein